MPRFVGRFNSEKEGGGGVVVCGLDWTGLDVMESL
jgi:hypothetical protein